jgi:hypothetical protein
MTNDITTEPLEGTMKIEEAKDYVNKLIYALVGCDLEYNRGAGKRYRVEVDLVEVGKRVSYVIELKRQPDTDLSSLPTMDIGENNDGEQENDSMEDSNNTTDTSSGADVSACTETSGS